MKIVFITAFYAISINHKQISQVHSAEGRIQRPFQEVIITNFKVDARMFILCKVPWLHLGYCLRRKSLLL